MDKDEDFSLDHIIMIAISELEENSADKLPEIYIDDRFKNYSVYLSQQQVSDMIYSIQSKLLPLLNKGYSRLNIVVIADKESPNIVDLGVKAHGRSTHSESYDEENERLAS